MTTDRMRGTCGYEPGDEVVLLKAFNNKRKIGEEGYGYVGVIRSIEKGDVGEPTADVVLLRMATNGKEKRIVSVDLSLFDIAPLSRESLDDTGNCGSIESVRVVREAIASGSNATIERIGT